MKPSFLFAGGGPEHGTQGLTLSCIPGPFIFYRVSLSWPGRFELEVIPASASQSAGLTGVGHHALPEGVFVGAPWVLVERRQPSWELPTPPCVPLPRREQSPCLLWLPVLPRTPESSLGTAGEPRLLLGTPPPSESARKIWGVPGAVADVVGASEAVSFSPCQPAPPPGRGRSLSQPQRRPPSWPERGGLWR